MKDKPTNKRDTMRKTCVYYIIQFLVVLVVLGVTGCRGDASNGSSDRKETKVGAKIEPLEMLKAVELLDKRDFSDEIDEIDSCLKKYAFSLAREHLQAAKAFISNDTEIQQLEEAKTRYQNEYAEYTAQKERERRLALEEKADIRFQDSVIFGINCIDRFCATRECEDVCRLAAASWKDNDERRALEYLCEIVFPRDVYECNRRKSLQSLIKKYRLTRP